MNKEEHIARYGKEAYLRHLTQCRKWKEEHPAYMENYRDENEIHVLKKAREYKKNCKAAIAIQRKGYIKDHKKELAEYQKLYRETPNGKAAHIAGETKRRRNLDFIALNSYFGNCEGHHITHTFVIYIPKGLHKSVWHNLNTAQGMEVINALALDFLINGF